MRFALAKSRRVGPGLQAVVNAFGDELSTLLGEQEAVVGGSVLPRCGGPSAIGGEADDVVPGSDGLADPEAGCVGHGGWSCRVSGQVDAVTGRGRVSISHRRAGGRPDGRSPEAQMRRMFWVYGPSSSAADAPPDS